MIRYYLGTPEPSWLWRQEAFGEPVDAPDGIPYRPYESPQIGMGLFVSHARLRRLKTLQPAAVPWALDSMGFTELQKHGRWTFTTEEYVRAIIRYQEEIGRLEWAPPMDWMCEEPIRVGGVFKGETFAGTGMSVDEHLELTVSGYVDATSTYDRIVHDLYPEHDAVPDIHGSPVDYVDNPILPVLQGDKVADYIRCDELYLQAGVDLRDYEVVGVGSVCRRQNTDEIVEIFTALADRGLLLHGFGLSTHGIRQLRAIPKVWEALVTADSQAWSKSARWAGAAGRTPDCTHRSEKCTWCAHYARWWRDRLFASSGLSEDDGQLAFDWAA